MEESNYKINNEIIYQVIHEYLSLSDQLTQLNRGVGGSFKRMDENVRNSNELDNVIYGLLQERIDNLKVENLINGVNNSLKRIDKLLEQNTRLLDRYK